MSRSCPRRAVLGRSWSPAHRGRRGRGCRASLLPRTRSCPRARRLRARTGRPWNVCERRRPPPRIPPPAPPPHPAAGPPPRIPPPPPPTSRRRPPPASRRRPPPPASRRRPWSPERSAGRGEARGSHRRALSAVLSRRRLEALARPPRRLPQGRDAGGQACPPRGTWRRRVTSSSAVCRRTPGCDRLDGRPRPLAGLAPADTLESAPLLGAACCCGAAGVRARFSSPSYGAVRAGAAWKHEAPRVEMVKKAPAGTRVRSTA